LKKESYAYGYELVFDKKSNSSCTQCININEIDSIPQEYFSYRVDFDTNQGRTIYLSAKSAFETFPSLTEWLFSIEGVVNILCMGNPRQLYYKKDANYTDALMQYWLIHIILPVTLTLDATYYFLHTGSVNVDDRAVLFTGESYAGKSTLTDYFLQKGHMLVSDDKLATFQKNEKFYCKPSHPYHRPYRAVEDLGRMSADFDTQELEIGMLYWLEPVEATESIEIRELKGLKKFESLRYATEMDLGVNQKNRFAYLTQMANKLTCYAIKVPRDLKRLDEVYDAIIAHTKTEGKK